MAVKYQHEGWYSQLTLLSSDPRLGGDLYPPNNPFIHFMASLNVLVKVCIWKAWEAECFCLKIILGKTSDQVSFVLIKRSHTGAGMLYSTMNWYILTQYGWPRCWVISLRAPWNYTTSPRGTGHSDSDTAIQLKTIFYDCIISSIQYTILYNMNILYGYSHYVKPPQNVWSKTIDISLSLEFNI